MVMVSNQHLVKAFQEPWEKKNHEEEKGKADELLDQLTPEIDSGTLLGH